MLPYTPDKRLHEAASGIVAIVPPPRMRRAKALALRESINSSRAKNCLGYQLIRPLGTRGRSAPPSCGDLTAEKWLQALSDRGRSWGSTEFGPIPQTSLAQRRLSRRVSEDLI